MGSLLDQCVENFQYFTKGHYVIEQKVDFFDFQFIISADGTLKETKFKDQILEPELGNVLFFVREKYLKKVQQHKFDKKKLESHNAEKQRMVDAWKEKEHHYQGHIRFQEKALQKKTRLLDAIGMIAHNVEKTNQN